MATTAPQLPLSPQAYDAKTRAFSMGRALAILEGLRGSERVAQRRAS